MAKLSVAIVAMNEAENLARTLQSVAWADEIVVVDSGSTDGTQDIAASFGAIVFQEPWRGYGAQVNAALDHTTHDWILNLDADEALTPELAASIRAALASPTYEAYTVPRLNQVFGRFLRHGGLYPDRKLRLFRRGAARLREDTEPHATPKTTHPTGRLTGDLLHFQYPTLAAYIDHMNRYSSAILPLLDARPERPFFLDAYLNPVATFGYNYILRLGFLDGREGLVFHLNHSVYVHWKYVKLWEWKRKLEEVAHL